MKLNITSIYENQEVEYQEYNLKKDDISSSVTAEPKIRFASIDNFNATYLKEPEFLIIKYKNLQNDL